MIGKQKTHTKPYLKCPLAGDLCNFSLDPRGTDDEGPLVSGVEFKLIAELEVGIEWSGLSPGGCTWELERGTGGRDTRVCGCWTSPGMREKKKNVRQIWKIALEMRDVEVESEKGPKSCKMLLPKVIWTNSIVNEASTRSDSIRRFFMAYNLTQHSQNDNSRCHSRSSTCSSLIRAFKDMSSIPAKWWIWIHIRYVEFHWKWFACVMEQGFRNFVPKFSFQTLPKTPKFCLALWIRKKNFESKKKPQRQWGKPCISVFWAMLKHQLASVWKWWGQGKQPLFTFYSSLLLFWMFPKSPINLDSIPSTDGQRNHFHVPDLMEARSNQTHWLTAAWTIIVSIAVLRIKMTALVKSRPRLVVRKATRKMKKILW